MKKVKTFVTSFRPLSLFVALGIVSVCSLSTAFATVTINSSAVNDYGNSNPSINLTSLGASDWLVLNNSGTGGSPKVYDEKLGGTLLTHTGLSPSSGAGGGDFFNATWTDGTNESSYSGGTGLYAFTSNATQTFTASIGAGETSTISFYQLSWVYNSSFVVTDSANNVLTTQYLPSNYDTRSSIVLNYSSDVADTLTFQYNLGNNFQQLGVAAVALTTVPEPSTWLAGLLIGSLALMLTFRRLNERPI